MPLDKVTTYAITDILDHMDKWMAMVKEFLDSHDMRYTEDDVAKIAAYLCGMERRQNFHRN
jgi:hypothetical protein